jgi:hypothetical protein
MSKYLHFKKQLDAAVEFIDNIGCYGWLGDGAKTLEKIAKEMLSTIQELEPVEIDPEFFNWQANKRNLNPNDWTYVYKEKSDGTQVLIGRIFKDNDLELFKPKKLKSPTNDSNCVEGLNWSVYWFIKEEDVDEDGLDTLKKIKVKPISRINEIFDDPWSTYEFNALGYKTPNGTIVHYDSYIED